MTISDSDVNFVAVNGDAGDVAATLAAAPLPPDAPVVVLRGGATVVEFLRRVGSPLADAPGAAAVDRALRHARRVLVLGGP